MSQGKSAVRTVISVVLVVLTVLGLINVYGDNAEVVKQAEQTACGEPGCAVQMTQMSRSPIGQSFTFQTALMKPGQAETSASVDVECKKSMIFFGDVTCTKP